MEKYLPLITGGSGALVVLTIGLWLFLSGHLHSDPEFRKLEAERDYWRDAYSKQLEASQIERRIVNDTAQAGQVNTQLLAAFVNLAAGKKPAPPAELTAEDLGL